jgi:3-oxoadipate enol-lactonase
MPEADVNDCSIYYELEGTGPAVVFIHGEDHGIEEFVHQVPYFRGRYRCLTYYRRGHGRSESVPYGYSLWQQTLDLAGLLDYLHIADVAIVGVGMGNPVAVSYALHQPGRVRGLALAVWFELKGYPALEEQLRVGQMSFCSKHQTMFEVCRAHGNQGLVEFIERNAQLFRHLPDGPELRSEVARLTASHPPEHYLQAAEFYLSLPNLLPDMHRIRCPILGICGRHDPAPDRPELMRDVPTFSQAWIEGAARFALMERPDEFNRVLASFLAALGPALVVA